MNLFHYRFTTIAVCIRGTKFKWRANTAQDFTKNSFTATYILSTKSTLPRNKQIIIIIIIIIIKNEKIIEWHYARTLQGHFP